MGLDIFNKTADERGVESPVLGRDTDPQFYRIIFQEAYSVTVLTRYASGAPIKAADALDRVRHAMFALTLHAREQFNEACRYGNPTFDAEQMALDIMDRECLRADKHDGVNCLVYQEDMMGRLNPPTDFDPIICSKCEERADNIEELEEQCLDMHLLHEAEPTLRRLSEFITTMRDIEKETGEPCKIVYSF